MHRTLALFFASAACLLAQSTTLFENDQVRVIKAPEQPHVKTALHEHKFNRVMVYLQPGRQDINYQDGKKTALQFKAGDVKWSPGGGMHVSEAVSDQPFTIIEVEVKKEGDPSKVVKTPLDPLKVAPKIYHLEYENSQVRVIRVHMAPHQQIPLHEHVLNRVVIYLTDQHGSQTTPDGNTVVAQHKAGEASWGTPVKHKEQNLSDTPFEGIVVELKN
jgi:uncharacterized RmlC-like cupin family protein